MAGEEEIRSVQDLEKRLSSVSFPFQEFVVPQSVIEWFVIFAKSHGTTRKILLVSEEYEDRGHVRGPALLTNKQYVG